MVFSMVLPLAAGLCLFTFFVHLVAGQRFVVAALDAAIEPFARATLLVVWHMVTWTLLLCAFALWFADRRSAFLVGALCAGYAGLFIAVAQRELQAAIRLPQWILLGAVAVFAFAGALEVGPSHAAAVLLASLALVHLGWALGVTWPARDRESLALAIIGRPVRPSAFACVLVAACLSGMIWLLVVPNPAWVRLIIAAIFIARGTLGFVEPMVRSEIIGTPYLSYSRFMYTPLALAIGIAVLLAR
jgi:hypothetical protein